MGSGEKFFSEARENSQVKAAIISKYFWAWAKIISPVAKRGSNKIGYIDLFAGPGRYDDGTRSTPLLVLEQAIKDPQFREMLVTIFNDGAPEHAESLRHAIAALPGVETLRYRPQVENEIIGEEVTKQFEGMNMIPSLCFVDPFGYKGLSLRLVNALVKNWACECLFFFNYNRINMGLGNDAVKQHMEALFGEERAAGLRTKLKVLSSEERELTVVEELVEALREMGGKYVLPFRFRNPAGNRTSHHLIFVSKHVLGYSIMKEIMARESSKREQGVASFEYNAADERYPLLFELNRPLDQLEKMLLVTFAGKQLAAYDVYERHHVGYPYVWENYQQALRNLEATKQITADPPAIQRPRRKGVVTFAKHVVVRFPSGGGR